MLALSGCASTACRLSLQNPEQQRIARTRIEDVDTATWAQLLLRGNNYTCSGTSLPQASKAQTSLLKNYRTLIRKDAAGEGRHLVWLIVQRSHNNLAGPVALVERSGNSLLARSVGTLELPAGQIEMRYNYGAHRESLWATSKVCRPVRALSRAACHEQLAVLVREGHAFVALPGLITTHRERVTALGNGWHHVKVERCAITEHNDRLVLAQSIDEHEIQAHRRHAQPRQRRSETQHIEVPLGG